MLGKPPPTMLHVAPPHGSARLAAAGGGGVEDLLAAALAKTFARYTAGEKPTSSTGARRRRWSGRLDAYRRARACTARRACFRLVALRKRDAAGSPATFWPCSGAEVSSDKHAFVALHYNDI